MGAPWRLGAQQEGGGLTGLNVLPMVPSHPPGLRHPAPRAQLSQTHQRLPASVPCLCPQPALSILSGLPDRTDPMPPPRPRSTVSPRVPRSLPSPLHPRDHSQGPPSPSVAQAEHHPLPNSLLPPMAPATKSMDSTEAGRPAHCLCKSVPPPGWPRARPYTLQTLNTCRGGRAGGSRARPMTTPTALQLASPQDLHPTALRT